MLQGSKEIGLWAGTPGKYIFILSSGKAGVGKTTFSKYLTDYLKSKGYVVTHQAFAQEIKNCAKEYFGWDGKKDARGRRLLQMLGTEVGRAYDQDLWVKHLVNKIRYGVVHPDFVIVDDWRFPNEAEYLSEYPEYDSVLVRIESQEREVLSGQEESNHASEHALPLPGDNKDYYDFIVYNDGSLEELENMAEQLINKLLERSKS